MHAAYGWHMRAAAWATNRDIAAARLSWERAQKIGDALPPDDPARAAMRIAPRTMLCGIAWRVHDHAARDRFDELRELCAAAGDKASLTIAMAGLVMDHAFQDRLREASQLASEAWALIESLGDSTLTLGLSFPMIYSKLVSAEFCDALRWSQRAIDLADGDPSKSNFLIGSPLALALTRGLCPGVPGSSWMPRRPAQGLAMARSADPMSYAMLVAWTYFPGISYGVLAADDRAVREIEEAVGIAERSGDDLAVSNARGTLGMALDIATRMPSVTADTSSWPRSATRSYAGDTTWPSYRSSTCTWRVRGSGWRSRWRDAADALRRRPSVRRGTPAGMGNSSDGCSGGDIAGWWGRR